MEEQRTKILLSATALGAGNCGLAFYRKVVKGYRPPQMSPRVRYGIAGHKFIDVVYKTGDLRLAKQAAEKAFTLPVFEQKSTEHLCDFKHLFRTASDIWFGWIADDQNFQVILDGDGKPLTEQTFQIPFHQGAYVDIDLVGTMDKIGKFNGGVYAIGDWKFTSSWDNKGYFKQYELSRQLKMYRLATRLEAQRNPESVMGKLGLEKNLGLFIDAIFLTPEASRVERSRIMNPSWEDISDFEAALRRWCVTLDSKFGGGTISYMKEGEVTGACEGKWGKCDFWNVCAAPKLATEVMLNANFQIKNWNPLDYNGLEDE
jgi:hypothetical protein